MTSPVKYLKPNVAFEPLICRWYAWPLLLAPATFAMFARNRLIPLLESFIDDPDFHRESAKDPALRGGAFLDYSGNVAHAEALLSQLQRTVKRQLEFADALLQVNDLLIHDGNGISLEPLYERMPEILRGLVELGYDLNNHATLRLIEPLLYASDLYDPAFQSVLLRQIGQEERPFVLVTPVIDASAGLLLEAPFAAPLYDELARMREQGLTGTELDRLGSSISQHGGDAARISDFLTETPPLRRYAACPTETVRIRYLGHAALLIEGYGTSILMDPSIGYETCHGIDHFSFADLPPIIDYVIITHNHQDHVVFETLLQLRYKIKHIIVPRNNGGFLQDPSLKLILEKAGFESVIELDELQRLKVPGGMITGLPFLGEHCDLHIRTKLGYQIELGGQRIMCLADSNNLDAALYARLAKLIAPPHLIFIGMECTGGPMSWLYGDLLPRRLRREHDQSRRLSGSNFERAWHIVEQFKPRGVLVYAMGAEPWFTHITSLVYTAKSIPIVESNKLVEHCNQENMVTERMYGKREILLANEQIILS